MGTQLAGKTLGIVGLGRIGQAVASRAQALEMKVIGFDPYLSDAKAEALGIQPVANPRDMFPLVDYLTVHTPLTDENSWPGRSRRNQDDEERRPPDQLCSWRNL